MHPSPTILKHSLTSREARIATNGSAGLRPRKVYRPSSSFRLGFGRIRKTSLGSPSASKELTACSRTMRSSSSTQRSSSLTDEEKSGPVPDQAPTAVAVKVLYGLVLVAARETNFVNPMAVRRRSFDWPHEFKAKQFVQQGGTGLRQGMPEHWVGGCFEEASHFLVRFLLRGHKEFAQHRFAFPHACQPLFDLSRHFAREGSRDARTPFTFGWKPSSMDTAPQCHQAGFRCRVSKPADR